MSEHFCYPASVVRDEAGFYLVTFPDFPEAATDANSREQALDEAADALEEAVAGRINRGDPIPHPSTRRSQAGTRLRTSTDGCKSDTLHGSQKLAFETRSWQCDTILSQQQRTST